MDYHWNVSTHQKYLFEKFIWIEILLYYIYFSTIVKFSHFILQFLFVHLKDFLSYTVAHFVHLKLNRVNISTLYQLSSWSEVYSLLLLKQPTFKTGLTCYKQDLLVPLSMTCSHFCVLKVLSTKSDANSFTSSVHKYIEYIWADYESSQGWPS